MKKTPLTYGGNNMPPDQLHSFMTEWSLSQAERNHVETLEEANDFNINDEESDDFFQNLTVYEMHEQAEENLALLQQIQETENPPSNALTPDTGQTALTPPGQPMNPQGEPLVTTAPAGLPPDPGSGSPS